MCIREKFGLNLGQVSCHLDWELSRFSAVTPNKCRDSELHLQNVYLFTVSGHFSLSLDDIWHCSRNNVGK